MTKPLPYPIPGPAGGLSTAGAVFPSTSSSSQFTPSSAYASGSDSLRASASASLSVHSAGKNAVNGKTVAERALFTSGTWPYVARALSLTSDNPLRLSLAILQHLALLGVSTSTSTSSTSSPIPALVTSVRWLSDDASVTLRDPTGTLTATVHADAMDKFANTTTPIDDGVVLLLQDVAPFSAVQHVGFRVDVSKSVHLYVTEENIKAVLTLDALRAKYGTQSASAKSEWAWATVDPHAMYTKYARCPPPAPVRRKVKPAATHRPLQPRDGNVNMNGNVNTQHLGRNQQQNPQNRQHNHYNHTNNNNYNNNSSRQYRPPGPGNSSSNGGNRYSNNQNYGVNNHNNNSTNNPKKRPFSSTPHNSNTAAHHATMNNRPGSLTVPDNANANKRPAPHSSVNSSFRVPTRPPSAQTPSSQYTPHYGHQAHRSSALPPQALPQQPQQQQPQQVHSDTLAFADDQLDSMLEDYDIDAIVNNHKKSQALTQTQPGSGQAQVRSSNVVEQQHQVSHEQGQGQNQLDSSRNASSTHGHQHAQAQAQTVSGDEVFSQYLGMTVDEIASAFE